MAATGSWRDLVVLLRRKPDFRRLFLATIVTFLGDWFAFVAVSELVIEVTGNPGLGAVAYGANVLPVFLAAPFAGVLADRLDRKRLFVVVNLVAVVPALGLLAASATGSAGLAIACLALIGVCAAFAEPISGAVLPNLVERRDLSLAQAALGSVWGTMLFVGAALGGVVAATFGRDTSFVVDALSFLAAAALVLRIRAPFRSGPVGAMPAGAGVLAHLGEVWAFVRPRKFTAALMVTKTGVGLANGIVGLLPAFALSRYGAGSAGIGLLLGARGFGSLIGPFAGRAIARAGGRRSPRGVPGGVAGHGDVDGRRLLVVCGGSIVAYAVAYAFLPLIDSLAVAAACVALAHAGGGAQWVLSTYGLQVTTPDAVRGRVLSLDFGLVTLSIGVSSVAAGAVAGLAGLEATSWGLAVLAFVYGSAWLWWTRDLWRAHDDPLAIAAAEEASRR